MRKKSERINALEFQEWLEGFFRRTSNFSFFKTIKKFYNQNLHAQSEIRYATNEICFDDFEKNRQSVTQTIRKKSEGLGRDQGRPRGLLLKFLDNPLKISNRKMRNTGEFSRTLKSEPGACAPSSPLKSAYAKQGSQYNRNCQTQTYN